jgi:hypothetical protein
MPAGAPQAAHLLSVLLLKQEAAVTALLEAPGPKPGRVDGCRRLQPRQACTLATRALLAQLLHLRHPPVLLNHHYFDLSAQHY